jgi:hypothetical protein
LLVQLIQEICEWNSWAAIATTIRPARTIGQSFSAVVISFSLPVAVSKKKRGKILTEFYDGPSHIPKHPSCFQHLPSAKAFAQLSGHPMGDIGTSAWWNWPHKCFSISSYSGRILLVQLIQEIDEWNSWAAIVTTIRPARTIGQSFSAVVISFSLHVAVSKKERGKILTESYDGPSHIPKHPSCFQHLPSAKSFAQLSSDYFWNGHLIGGRGARTSTSLMVIQWEEKQGR